MQYAML